MSGQLPGNAQFITTAVGGQTWPVPGPGPARNGMATPAPGQRQQQQLQPQNAVQRLPQGQMHVDPRQPTQAQSFRISQVPRVDYIPSSPQGTVPSEDQPIVEIQDVDDIRSISTQEGARKKLTTYHLKRIEKLPEEEYTAIPGTLSWKKTRTILVTNISQAELKRQIDMLNHYSVGTVLQKKDSLPLVAQTQVEKAAARLEETDPQRDLFCYNVVQLEMIWVEMTPEERLRHHEAKHGRSRSRHHHRRHHHPVSSEHRSRSKHEQHRSTHDKVKTTSHYQHTPRSKKYKCIGLQAFFERVPRDSVDALKLLRDRENERNALSPQYSMAVPPRDMGPVQLRGGQPLGSLSSFRSTFPAGAHMGVAQQQQLEKQGLGNAQEQFSGQQNQAQFKPRLPQNHQQQQLPAGPAGPGPQQGVPGQARRQSFVGGNQTPQFERSPSMQGGAAGQPPQNRQQQMVPHQGRGAQQGQTGMSPRQNSPNAGGSLPGGAAMIKINSGGNRERPRQYQASQMSAASSRNSMPFSEFSEERVSSCSSLDDDDDEEHYTHKAYHGAHGAGPVAVVPRRPETRQDFRRVHAPPHSVPRAPVHMSRITYADLRENPVFDDCERRYDPRRAEKPQVINRPASNQVRYVQGTSAADIETVIGRTSRMNIHDGDEPERGRRVFRERRYSWGDDVSEDSDASSNSYLTDPNNPFRQTRYQSRERRSSVGTRYYPESSLRSSYDARYHRTNP